jgi:hypothetical protein
MPDIPTAAIASAAKAASHFKPWATVRRHDRLIRQEHEDLLTFARDQLQVEAQALEEARKDLAARGALQSGEFGAALTRVRDESAKRWRDFKRTSDRKIEEMKENEGVTVRVWRVIRRKPWPVNPNASELRELARPWEDEAVRREAVEREVAPQQRAAQETAVWFFPEEKIWDVDQAAGYRGQIRNRGPDEALHVMAQIVAETGQPLADAVEAGDLAAGASTQREFTVECPHPRLFCVLTWRNESGEELRYQTGQIFPANPVA